LERKNRASADAGQLPTKPWIVSNFMPLQQQQLSFATESLILLSCHSKKKERNFTIEKSSQESERKKGKISQNK